MEIKGVVGKGKGEGKKLGFPTANIAIYRTIQSGVFAGKVKLEGREHTAAIFIPKDESKLEAYILDFAGDLYGKEIEVAIEWKVRDVVPYESEEKMKALIASDIKRIREYTYTK